MIERIKRLLEYYNLSSSNFAERIDVPRSSISHLLSGRNKPSLDFVMKVDNAFREVSIEWLLYGRGNFPKSKEKSPSLFEPKPPEIEAPTEQKVQYAPKNEDHEEMNWFNTENKRVVSKIILLYNDGTFEEFDK